MAHYVYDTRLFTPQAEALVVNLGDPAQINCRPGKYTVGIYINDVMQDTRTLRFLHGKTGCLRPRWTPALLKTLGVNLPRFLPAREDTLLPGTLSEYVPGAKEKFDVQSQNLYLTFPPDALKDTEYALSRGRWDEGKPAVLVGYQYNGQRMRDAQATQTGSYLGLDEGINLGAWRLRGRASRIQYGTASEWAFFNNRLERDVMPLNSRLLLGEGVTSPDVFPSLAFYGVRLSTAGAMLPYRLQHPAPVIRGTASSPSRVTVTQNGNIIYSGTVPPGPFTVTGVRTNGTGDLQVTVTAQNGSVTRFTVANTLLPIMMAGEAFKYEAIAGRTRPAAPAPQSGGQPFTLFSAAYGVNGALTLYSGLIKAKHYTSPALGFSLPVPHLGAVSLEVSAGSANRRHGSASGRLYAARYAHAFSNGQASLNVNALHRTRGFYTLSEAGEVQYCARTHACSLAAGEAPADEMQLEVTRTAGALGSLSAVLSTVGYRSSGLRTRTASVAYTYYHQGATFSLSYGRLSGGIRRERASQDMLSVSISLPLGAQSDDALTPSYATYSLYNDNNYTVQSTGINGALDQGRFSWSAEHGLSGAGQNNISTQYNADRLAGSAGYYQSGAARSLSYGLSGGLIIHQHGVNFTRSVGGATTVVRVGHVKGVHLTGGDEAATDGRGEVVASWLLPYQRNTFSVDPDTLPQGVRLLNDSINVYPTQDAFIFREIAATEGGSAIFRVRFEGKPIPFGAVAHVDDGRVTSPPPPFIVGGGGILYLSGVALAGKVRAQWAGKECIFDYKMEKEHQGRHIQDIDCHQPN